MSSESYISSVQWLHSNLYILYIYTTQREIIHGTC